MSVHILYLILRNSPVKQQTVPVPYSRYHCLRLRGNYVICLRSTKCELVGCNCESSIECNFLIPSTCISILIRIPLQCINCGGTSGSFQLCPSALSPWASASFYTAPVGGYLEEVILSGCMGGCEGCLSVHDVFIIAILLLVNGKMG